MNRALAGVGEVIFLGEFLKLELDDVQGGFRSLGQYHPQVEDDVWPFVRKIKEELGVAPPLLVSATSPLGPTLDKRFWEHPPEDLQVSIVAYEEHSTPHFGLSFPVGHPNRPIIEPQQFLNEYLKDKSEEDKPNRPKEKR